jgi:hypothetical protein
MMKKLERTKRMVASVMLVACSVVLSVGCKKPVDSPDDDPSVITGETIDLGDGSEAYEIKENMTLKAINTYILKGWVYVVDGVTLTIEPGVIIKGDRASKATLIIERGAKIMAQGTKEKPIVMTSSQAPGSRKPGDWGGLIICGKARTNKGEQTIEGGVRSKHGGNDDNDNSGVLSYVRVEFAGIEYQTDNEINGITLGSVGAGTQIDHVQVSYPGDDSYEWFGGCVNAKYLVSLGCWDDDFDTDNGFSGKIQFAVALRDPLIADQSASNGFESDNDADGSTNSPKTSAVFANVSIFGPVANPTSYTDQGGVKGHTDATKVRFQAGLHLRRHTELSIFNSLIAAFPIGIIIENDKGSATQTNATDGKLNVTNCVLAGCVKNFQDAQYWTGGKIDNGTPSGDAWGYNYFTRTNGGNSVYATLAELKLGSNPLDIKGSGLFPQSDSPLASGAVWTNAKVSSWFQQVNYRGAFGPSETASSNWMTGWTNFDPQNTTY